jgi:hypothetical protein
MAINDRGELVRPAKRDHKGSEAEVNRSSLAKPAEVPCWHWAVSSPVEFWSESPPNARTK